MSVCKRNAAFLASVPLLLAPAVHGTALAQGSSLAALRAQIQRYGCDLPQYATSVAGCRSLHARVRALSSGNSTPARARQSYSGYSSHSSRRTTSPPPPSSGGSFFGSLFGGGSSQPRYSNRGSYGSGGSSSFYGWSGGYGRYRTLCVRTCDGYYFPISFSTTRSGFTRDAQRCESSCGTEAKLFVHRNPGAGVEHSTDLEGQRYVNLENAFRYREEYVKGCSCKPAPWSEAAQEEYERRAEQEENQDGGKTAANGAADEPATDASSAPAAASGYVYNLPATRSSRRRRNRYIANDPAHEGRWWAGSW